MGGRWARLLRRVHADTDCQGVLQKALRYVRTLGMRRGSRGRKTVRHEADRLLLGLRSDCFRFAERRMLPHHICGYNM